MQEQSGIWKQAKKPGGTGIDFTGGERREREREREREGVGGGRSILFRARTSTER